jgi:predicted metal-dependent hydrolase
MQLGLPFEDRREAPLEFYYVRHRRARRYVVRVDGDGRVRVTIPRGGSRREADAFAERQADWIRSRVEEYREARSARPEPTSDEKRRLRAIARATLAPRLLELAASHGLVVTRVSIRDQRNRWGSCGRDGHICLNWRLVQMPDWVRDYVLIHELMHLRRMDHSPKYWRLVEDACPEYHAARRWLRCHGPGLR